MKTIHTLDEARSEPSARSRLMKLRVAGETLHNQFVGSPRVVSVHSFALVTLPYPARVAFDLPHSALTPMVALTHRAWLIQTLDGGLLRNILFAPSVLEGLQSAPRYQEFRKRMGPLASPFETSFDTLEAQLARLGLGFAQMDLVAFNDLNGESLRDFSSRFPNAKLMCPKVEWQRVRDPHPCDRSALATDGISPLPPERLELLESDVELGEGAWLVRTPGATRGHQTLFLHTDSGIWGVSANGSCVDAWAAFESTIESVSRYAKAVGVEVLPCAHAESQSELYTSMVLERTVVDRLHLAPAFPQMVSSRALTSHPLTPRLKPTAPLADFRYGSISVGEKTSTR